MQLQSAQNEPALSVEMNSSRYRPFAGEHYRIYRETAVTVSEDAANWRSTAHLQISCVSVTTKKKNTVFWDVTP
jgi:hypothetical protein